MRYSGLALRSDSPRRHELRQAAAQAPEIAELCRVLHILDEAHALRRDALARCQLAFEKVPIIELLAWGSLYAFEHLVPHDLHGSAAVVAQGVASGECLGCDQRFVVMEAPDGRSFSLASQRV